MLHSDTCQGCRDGKGLPFEFTMAFQPIVDLTASRVWAYEALVRGPDGQSAAHVLKQVTEETLYKFDQACRVKAIELMGSLSGSDSDTKLSINFMPNAVYEPSACIRASIAAAKRSSIRLDRLMFEFTENERFSDPAHVGRIVEAYHQLGFLTALDDFGAGFAGLSLLAALPTNVIKVDMDLVRDIDTDARKRVIVAGIVRTAHELGIEVIAEGIETASELKAVFEMGVRLCQGYYFAKPEVRSLPSVDFAACDARMAA